MNNFKLENSEMNNIYSNTKSVSFSNDAKSYDGTSQKNIIYSNIIFNFFKKQIKTPHDILNITKDEKLLSFFLEESKIAKAKLEYISKINKNIFFKILSYKNMDDSIKTTGFSIIRTGSRDINFKFLPSHLKNINKLIVLLNYSVDILKLEWKHIT